MKMKKSNSRSMQNPPASPLKEQLGLVITKTPSNENVQSILKIAINSLRKGTGTDLFALGDAGWLVKQTTNKKSPNIFNAFRKAGGRIIVSDSQLQESGVKASSRMGGFRVSPDPYGELVDLIMKKWNHVVVV